MPAGRFAGAYRFPAALDRDTQLALNYQVLGLPTSYFVDATDIIRDRVIGTMSAGTMQAKAQRVIGQANQRPTQPGSITKAAGIANTSPSPPSTTSRSRWAS